MEIELKTADGEAVVKVTGCLDTAAAADFGRTVGGIPDSAKKVTFEFSELEFIASSALRVMVTLAKARHATGGGVTVVGANDIVRDVFEMTGLVEVFEVL